MTLDPFSMPGGDPFKNKKDDPHKNFSDEIFTKPNEGGSGAWAAAARLKAEDEARKQLDREFEEDFKKYDKVKDPPPPPKPVVVLSNPKWGAEQGIFGQKIIVSVEGAIPREIEHRTKVTFTVYALPPNGERDRIGFKEEHIRNGIAEVEIDLWQPHANGPKGESLESCPYIFEAKHTCSTVLTSERLHVSKTEFSLDDLRVVLETLETEKGAEAVRIFIGDLNYKALCNLAKKGTSGNDPNKMPSRFLLLPGSDDSKLEATDAHYYEESHKVSISNLRKGLNAIGHDCTVDGSFDQALQDAFEKYLQSLTFPKKNNASIHKVQKGETLGGIALKYGLHSWKQIYDLNKNTIGSNPDFIRAGKELKIPDRSSSRGERLIRNAGGDPQKLMGGVRYVYPWVHFSIMLTDENGVSINFEKEHALTLESPDKGSVVHTGKISGHGPFSIFIPYGKEFELRVNGFDLGEKNV